MDGVLRGGIRTTFRTAYSLVSILVLMDGVLRGHFLICCLQFSFVSILVLMDGVLRGI